MTETERSPAPTARAIFLVLAGTFFLLIACELLWMGSTAKSKLLVLETLTLLPVFVFVLVRKYPFRETFRWQRVNGAVLLVSGVIGVGLSIVIDELDTLIQILIPMPEELYQAMREFLLFDTMGELAIIVVATVVVASFAEEMLFRGFFQGALEKMTDVTKAVLVTAFVFAFVHFNPWWFVEILILGVCLGVLVWRSGSIFPSVIVHGVNNALSVLLINTGSDTLGWYRFKGHVSPIWLILGLGCIVFGFRVFYGLTEKPSSISYS